MTARTWVLDYLHTSQLFPIVNTAEPISYSIIFKALIGVTAARIKEQIFHKNLQFFMAYLKAIKDNCILI